MKIITANSSASEENINGNQPRPRWFIALDWYRQNNRSFLTLARSGMCPKCNERLKEGEGEISASDIFTTIKDCCSHVQGYISGELPILESIFRFFLANGNEPLDVEELGKQLSECRDGDTYRTSAEILSRLLESDQYYGLRQVEA